jgi:hypothetical protein
LIAVKHGRRLWRFVILDRSGSLDLHLETRSEMTDPAATTLAVNNEVNKPETPIRRCVARHLHSTGCEAKSTDCWTISESGRGVRHFGATR